MGVGEKVVFTDNLKRKTKVNNKHFVKLNNSTRLTRAHVDNRMNVFVSGRFSKPHFLDGLSQSWLTKGG